MTAQPTQQVVLTLTQLNRDTAYRAAAAFSELIEPAADAVSVFEDGPNFRVDAYYGGRELGTEALTQLIASGAIDHDITGKAALSAVPDENWVALSQAALPPVHAGRFIICGSHDLHRVPRGRHTLVVEAGEAFGTAHHATTYGCLLALDRLTRQKRFRNTLDLGTGTGVLALALARAQPQARIIATDIDERSVEVAKSNAIRNGLGDLAGGPEFVLADGVSDGYVQSAAPFDLVIANILAGPLNRMAPEISGILGSGAILVLSGILIPQAAQVVARYRSLGLDLCVHNRHNGWSTLVMRVRNRRNRGDQGDISSLFVPAYD